MIEPVKRPQVQIDVTQVSRVIPKQFIVDLVIDDQILRMQLQAMNLESMSSQLNILAAANLPRVQGWNIYSAEGTLLASVSVVDFLALVAAQTPLKDNPADKGGSGFRALPQVTHMSKDFKDSIAKAKAEGRVPE